MTLADVISAVAYALPAIEIVGSRIANWNIKLLDTVADNASAGAVRARQHSRASSTASTCACAAW